MEQALPKVLGILGGLGPMATVYFYEMLTRHTQAARDQDHIDVIINSRATTPDRTSYILGQSAENPFDIMAADARACHVRRGCHRHPLQHRPLFL